MDDQQHFQNELLNYLTQLLPFGSDKVMYELGKCLWNKSITQSSHLHDTLEYGEAVEQSKMWLQKAAIAGETKAMYLLGTFMLDELLYPPSYQKEGEKWLRRAAKSGNTKAMIILGECILDGELAGTQEEGKDWFQKAIQQGDFEAMLLWADRRLTGKGVKQDLHEGEKILRNLAELGITDAMVKWGKYLYEQKDAAIGENWIKQAAKRGNRLAHQFLAERKKGTKEL